MLAAGGAVFKKRRRDSLASITSFINYHWPHCWSTSLRNRFLTIPWNVIESDADSAERCGWSPPIGEEVEKMARAIRLLLFPVFATPFLWAQFSGAIQGTVVDSTQASVPDAVVTATNSETGITRMAKTSNEGFYRISNLGPGTYSVKAQKPGFSAS